MIECDKCGANLSLKDECCPYCGTENPDAIEHVRMMKYYQAEYNETREELVTKTRREAPLHVKRVIIAGLVAFFVLTVVVLMLVVEIIPSVRPSRIQSDHSATHFLISRSTSLQKSIVEAGTEHEDEHRHTDDWRDVAELLYSFMKEYRGIMNTESYARKRWTVEETKRYEQEAEENLKKIECLLMYYANVPADELKELEEKTETEMIISLRKWSKEGQVNEE